MTELDRTKVTFEQAEGLEPLPTQLQPRELSQGLRAGLWNVLHSQLVGATRHIEMSPSVLGEPWNSILFDVHVRKNHQPADEFSHSPKTHIAALKRVILHGSYVEVFGLIQWILRLRGCPFDFAKGVERVLSYYKAGYRLTEDRRTLVPIASEEDAKVAQKAFAALNTNVYSGARKHLTTAAERLTAGDWPGAIRESMQAVESVVRVLTGEGAFSKAIAVLEERWSIHGSLKAAFGNLYGYTSDEPGIRHPLLDDPKAAVDEADALFMFGACSSFVSYLVGKERQSRASRA